jgi:hypothetical protein
MLAKLDAGQSWLEHVTFQMCTMSEFVIPRQIIPRLL